MIDRNRVEVWRHVPMGHGFVKAQDDLITVRLNGARVVDERLQQLHCAWVIHFFEGLVQWHPGRRISLRDLVEELERSPAQVSLVITVVHDFALLKVCFGEVLEEGVLTLKVFSKSSAGLCGHRVRTVEDDFFDARGKRTFRTLFV